MRDRISGELGIELYDIYGLTEILRTGHRHQLQGKLRNALLG